MPFSKERCGEGTSRPLLEKKPRCQILGAGGLLGRLMTDAAAASLEAPESISRLCAIDDAKSAGSGVDWVDQMACAAGRLVETEQIGEVARECGLDRKRGGAGDRKSALGDDDQVDNRGSKNIRW